MLLLCFYFILHTCVIEVSFHIDTTFMYILFHIYHSLLYDFLITTEKTAPAPAQVDVGRTVVTIQNIGHTPIARWSIHLKMTTVCKAMFVQKEISVKEALLHVVNYHWFKL